MVQPNASVATDMKGNKFLREMQYQSPVPQSQLLSEPTVVVIQFDRVQGSVLNSWKSVLF